MVAMHGGVDLHLHAAQTHSGTVATKNYLAMPSALRTENSKIEGVLNVFDFLNIFVTQIRRL